jgi:hypothetical protein
MRDKEVGSWSVEEKGSRRCGSDQKPKLAIQALPPGRVFVLPNFFVPPKFLLNHPQNASRLHLPKNFCAGDASQESGFVFEP